MKLTLHKGQKLQVTLSPVSVDGRNMVSDDKTPPSMKKVPAGSAVLTTQAVVGEQLKMNGKPQWHVEDGDVSVEPSDDGLSAWIKAGDTYGSATVIVEAEIDFGLGMKQVRQKFDVEVEDPMVASLGARAGAAMSA